MHLAQYIPPKQLDFDKNSQESANSDDKGNQFDLCQEKVNKLLNQPIKFEPQIYFLPHKNYKVRNEIRCCSSPTHAHTHTHAPLLNPTRCHAADLLTCALSTCSTPFYLTCLPAMIDRMKEFS